MRAPSWSRYLRTGRTLAPEEAKQGAAESEDGPSLSLLSHLARKYRIWILGGTVLRRSDSAEDGRPTNHCTVWDDQGVCRAAYDKIHLFDAAIPGGAVFQEANVSSPVYSPSLSIRRSAVWA